MDHVLSMASFSTNSCPRHGHAKRILGLYMMEFGNAVYESICVYYDDDYGAF